jgi:hypothetical protein
MEIAEGISGRRLLQRHNTRSGSPSTLRRSSRMASRRRKILTFCPGGLIYVEGDRKSRGQYSVHVLNFFIGPQNFTLSTVRHVTFDRETGELKVEILKEKVYCK